MAAALIPTARVTFFLLIGTLVGSTLGLTVYSYVVWRADPDRVPPAGRTPA